MKKNKYDERESEFRTLKRRQWEIYDIQRNQCWAELDEPEPYGWYVVAVLRDDISRRADADTIQEALDLVKRPCWTREKRTGFRWKGHTCTITGKRDWQEYTPWGGSYYHSYSYSIDYNNWVKLRPEVRRWFTPPAYIDYWGRGWCECNIPTWFWGVKFERCMATHYLEIDTDLQSEDAWIDNHIDGKFYKEERMEWRTYPKRNPYTSKQRAHNKHVLNKMKQYGWDDSVAEFHPRKDDKWDWD